MRYTFIGRNMEIGDRTKEKITAKLNRIQKLFPADATAVVVLSAVKQVMNVEVTIPVNKRIIRAEVAETDMMAAVDKAVDILESQIIKYKRRMQVKSRHNAAFQAEYDSIPVAEEDLDDSPLLRIEKNKRFELKPMDVEEAVMQMELLGHTFFVFRNGDNDAVGVVYKRKDGSYGLIESD